MKAKTSGNLAVAGLLAFGVAAFAQTAGQQPTQPQTQPGTKMTDQQIIVTGCVQSEADYRRAHDAGKGGVAGTGVGVGNEFVLTEATTSAGAGATATGEPAAPTGTAGSAARSMAYELTGEHERQVGQFVGRRVEITGKLKAADHDSTGRPTGGATAGQPPSGVDVSSKDLKLREIEVTSVREAAGTCSAIK